MKTKNKLICWIQTDTQMHGQDKHNYINAIFRLCCTKGIGFTNPIEEENKKPSQMTMLQRGRETRKKEREERQTESEIDDQGQWQWGPEKR